MTDTIKPALTPEEWETWEWPYVAHGVGPDGRWGVDHDRSLQHRHALAALALHGLPEGFTRQDAKDVVEADECVWAAHSEFCVGDCRCSELSTRLRSLAARIESLLPPLDAPPQQS